ncbi:hypothetical protein C8F01DRAFT_1149979 [Mycena amicta]|nr:hypothetical protein C8F01DRAFT_1149979 [Mycena amicta]
MSPTHLPDEIISIILTQALEIPDKTFGDTSTESPFSKYRASSSDCISVCKPWARVGTPLLYHTVILRSQHQAVALERALKRVDGVFGQYIRKLRLEGSFGPAIQTIIQAAPNITDLFVSVNLWPTDNATHLCEMLPTMNPMRVILFDVPNHGPTNNNINMLRHTLTRCIQLWRNLTIFEFPDACASQWSLMIGFAASLSVSPNLRTIVIPFTPIFLNVTDHLSLMAKNPTLQRIHMRQPRKWEKSQIISFEAITQDPVLSKLVELPVERVDLEPPSQLKSTLQYSTSEVPDHVWSRIMGYALALDPENPRPIDRKPYLGLVTVCKLFERLAQTHLHSTMVLRGSFAMMDFLLRLERNPSIRPDLRALFFELPYTAWTVSLDQLFDLDSQSTSASLNLISLVGIEPFPLSTRLFNNFAQHCGHSLVRIDGLSLMRDHGKEHPAVWGAFKSLRVLSLESRVFWHAAPQEIPMDALPRLEHLYLGCNHPGAESLVRVFAGMHLPVLQHAAFTSVSAIVHHTSKNVAAQPVTVTDKLFIAIKRFLGTHGPGKLQRLDVPWVLLEQDAAGPAKWPKVFDLCDRLVHLEVSCPGNIPQSDAFKVTASNTDGHTALKKITFALAVDGHRQWRTMERNWSVFLETFNVNTFPSLKEVVLPCIKWPTNEHEIAKSLWVDAAERLLDAGVQLLDEEGVGWRRRLGGRISG